MEGDNQMIKSQLQMKDYQIKEKIIKEGWQGHLFAVLGLDFSPDGRWMVSSGFDGTVRLWNYRTKTQEKAFFFLSEAIEEVSISPNGRYIVAITSESSKAYLHDRKTNETSQIASQFVLRGVSAWNPDSNQLALVDYEDRLLIIDPSSKEEVFQMKIDELGGRSLSWHPSPNIAVGLRNGNIKILDISKRKTLITLDNETFNGHLGQVNGLCFLSSEILASCADDERVLVWRASTGEMIAKFKGKLGAVSLHGKEDMIAVGYENSLQIFSLTESEPLLELKHGITGSVVRIEPNKMTVARGLRENEIVFWSMENGNEVFSFKGHKKTIEVAAMDLDKGLLVCGSNDRLINVYDLKKRGEISHQMGGHSEAVSSITILPKLSIAASGSYDDTLRFWNYVDGTSQGLITGLPLISSLTFINNTDIIAVACSGDFSLRFYENMKILAALDEVHQDFINKIISLEDGTVLSASDDGTIKATSLNPQQTREFLNLGKPITEMAISHDQRKLVIGCEDGSIYLVKYPDNVIIQESKISDPIKSITFSKDDLLILIGHQATLSCWDWNANRTFTVGEFAEPITAIFPIDYSENEWDFMVCCLDESIRRIEIVKGADTIESREENQMSLVEQEISTPEPIISKEELDLDAEWESNTIKAIITQLKSNISKVTQLLTLAQEEFAAQVFESGTFLKRENLQEIVTLLIPLINEIDTILSMAIQYTTGLEETKIHNIDGATTIPSVQELQDKSKKTIKIISEIINWGSRWKKPNSE